MQIISSNKPNVSWTLRQNELRTLAGHLKNLLPPRLVVAGGPRAGKTTLVQALDRPALSVRGTDQLRGLEWSASSVVASTWLDMPGPWICEGVVMARALRKWLARVPERSPADLVIFLREQVAARSPGQDAMARGCDTVWREILPELTARGTKTLEF